MTQQTTTAALDAISARRKEETERCPEGFERSMTGPAKRIGRFRASSACFGRRRKAKTAAPMMPVKLAGRG